MKKIQTLVIGLMLVTMLSLLAIPALAAPEAATSHSEGTGCAHGSYYVYVVGYYDSGTPDVFYDGATSPQFTSSFHLQSYSDTIAPTIVYATSVGKCSTCGIYVEATAWVSPITFPYQHGGSVRTWY